MESKNFALEDATFTQWNNQLIWSIKDFKQLSDKHKEIFTPKFTLVNSDCMWKLSVANVSKDKRLKFKLIAENLSTPNFDVQGMVVLLLDKNQKFIGYVQTVVEYKGAALNLGSYRNTAKPKLHNKLEEFMSDDCGTLTILFNIRFVQQPVPVVSRTPTLEFDKMLDRNILTDVTINIDDQQIEAHRIILIARSEYFKELFDGEKKNQNSITITGVNVGVFKIILSYIYKGFVDDSVFSKNCAALFVAADLFKLYELKKLCETVLCESITIETAVDFLVIADKYLANSLKTVAIDFIQVFLYYIDLTEAWQRLILTHPNLVIDITLNKIIDCDCKKLEI